MDDLSNNIYRYYLDHFADLPIDKQFHFVSRLYLWSGDSELLSYLDLLRPGFTCDESPSRALAAAAEASRTSASHGTKNVAALRQPYFDRYPKLKTCVVVLFRALFLESVYHVEAKQSISTLFTEEDLHSLYETLVADSEAIAILSTHAINFLYLYTRFIKQDETLLGPSLCFEARKHYDEQDNLQLQLLVYLYTHSIIAESLFYSRAIPGRFNSTYQQIILELENIVEGRFEDINLDNKFEFLVCNRLLERTSKLESKIMDEATASLSPDGSFLVDTLNHNPSSNIALDDSEHRNVLFIMAHSPFKPRL